MSFNAWLYAYASPVNLTDPSGFRARDKWDDYRLEILRFGIDIASDNNDGIGSISYGVAKRAIGYVVRNFLRGSAVSDVQCYTRPVQYPNMLDLNRFDDLFSGWVDYWKWRGARAGINVPSSLTPSLMKAQAYKESRIGNLYNTSTGQYIENPNVMQVSPGAALELAGYIWPTYQTVDKLNSPIGWGFIRIIDRNRPYMPSPVQSIGAGIRYSIYMYELHANTPPPPDIVLGNQQGDYSKDPEAIRWMTALYYYGPRGADGRWYGLRIWQLYQTGVLSYYTPDNVLHQERVFYPPVIPPH